MAKDPKPEPEHLDLSTARAQLSQLVARANAGERFVITRYGRPLAVLCPVSERDLVATPATL